MHRSPSLISNPARSLVARLLLILTLGLAAGALILPESPAYAQSGKRSGKKSSKKKSSKRKGKKKAKKRRTLSKDDKKAPSSGQDPATPAAATPASPPGGQDPATPAPNAAKQDGPDAGQGAPAADGTDGATDDATANAATEEEGPDVDALRQEYLKLRDELFRSRARAATVASAMYSTRLRINLTFSSGRFYTVTRAVIRLDGASVFDDAGGVIANDAAPRFEGYVAPGRHVVTVRIEATGKDDERFTSAVENTFSIQAPAGKDVTVTVKAKDDGDIAYAWQKKQKGSYQPSLSIAVSTSKRATSDKGKTARRGQEKPKKTRTAEAGNGR